MIPDLKSARSIFLAAVAEEPGEERTRYLDSACGGDETLRREVLRLLNAYGDLDSFMKHPAAAALTIDLQPAEQIGATIGRYKLLEQIGEGGMGVVYVAEQSEPVRRRVALKIIKPGMDTRQVIARFEAERQALALMDHANIAKVHDAGATEAGRPYFVMELVRGMPITEYCDQARQDVRGRLALFMTVCQAVQHAHQKGVIHRDIKPSNVLVTMHDSQPVVKIIDFGIAKAINQQLTERTIYTAFTELIGTPLYMSPEQAELSGLDVDTRSDVYSLGVLLYELLTGHTPFDRETLVKSGLDEVRRMIREDEPQRPSHRISTLKADAGTTISQRRGIDQRQLTRQLRGELDWIVMKALEKDRNRRYESASAFAADVGRYLAGQSVEAYPPTRRYRLTKFVRRNRAALLTATVVVAALLIGLGASVWQAVRATNAERAKGAALVQAREAVDAMYTKVAEDWLARQGALTEVQRELLEKALAFYESFSKESGTDLDVQYEASRALIRVGVIHKRLGDDAAAKTAFLGAIDRIAELRELHPEGVESAVNSIKARAELSYVLRPRDLEEQANEQLALAVLEVATIDALKIQDASLRKSYATALELLSSELTMAGRVGDAQTTVEKAINVWQSLVEEFPKEFDYRSGLAGAYYVLGIRQMWWGSRDGKAEATYRHVDALLTKLLQERPGDVNCRSKLSATLTNLGMVLSWQNRNEEALKFDRRLLEVAEGLANEFPDDPGIQDGYRIALGNLATSLDRTGQGQPGESDRLFLKMLAVLEKLVDRYPDEIGYCGGYASSVLQQARYLRGQKKFDEADVLLERASGRLATIADRHSDHRGIASILAQLLWAKAARLIEQGDYRTAAQCFDAYPNEARRFLPDDFSQPDDAPQKHLGNKIKSYCEQGQLLLTPAVLLEDCVDLARADSSLAKDERATLVAQYTALANQFRQEGDRAVDALLSALASSDDEGKNFTIRGEQLITEWLGYRDGSEANPKYLRAAFCRVHQLMLRRLIQEAATQLADKASQLHISVLLSAAPEELRDVDLALTMARRSVELAPDDGLAKLSLGWAMFRKGHWQECLDVLDHEAMSKDDEPGSTIIAMALWKLDRRDDARARYEGAENRLKEYEKKDREADGIFPLLSMLKRLHQEAAAMFSADETARDGDNNDDTEVKSSGNAAALSQPG
jgi:tetratricopeptide (TPR) repeat protein/tRNA A-37 threonylcarbamoyl transferase component Bud32